MLLACGGVADAGPPEAAELLIRWAPGAARPTVGLDSLHRANGLLTVSAILPSGRWAARRAGGRSLDRWTRLRFDGSRPLAALLREYGKAPGVERIQPNILRRLTTFSTDDPLLEDQWNLDAVGWTEGDPGSAAGVLVAIVDSGVDDDHPDLAAQIWQNAAEAEGHSGVDDDGNGYVDDVAGWDFTDAPGLPGDGDFVERDADPDDESGHGTHVAGIVAAINNNGLGIAGVAPGATLMVLRAGFNIGSAGYLQDDDVAAAIVYAADNGADVINLSLGDPRYSPLLADAVQYAADLDVVVVAAAGNEGSSQVYYPARLDPTIAVAAAGRTGQRLSFSNHGASIDLIAPGLAVLSTQPGGGYGLLSGTSMAAPHVSAAVALVRAQHPEYSRLQVLGAIVAAAQDRQTVGWDRSTGHGHLRLPPFTVASPLVVAIVDPPTDRQTSATTIDILAAVEAPTASEYHIEWGRGESPQSFEPITSGVLAAGIGRPTGEWSTEGLEAGRYTLRVRADDAAGRTHEDRVIVDFIRDAANIIDMQVRRVLQGDRWRDVVEWQTDRPASGRLEVHRAGETVLRMTTVADTEHVVILPPDLAPGSYGVALVADASAGGIGIDTDSLWVEPSGIRRWDLVRSDQVRPDGYVLPQFSDFDGDGRGELAAMIYGGGAYGVTSFFEQGVDLPEFTSKLLFIPWESGDFDLDGHADLLAVDARRVRILESGSPGAFPARVAWETADVWGGEVADVDGDGRPELLLPSATGALFRLFEADGDDAYAETAVLVNETPGENDSGSRQSVGDLDGDGSVEWIAGDSDGDLIAFESVGDDTYRRIWSDVIEFADVDGRLLSPAADLDGDGEQEFISGRLQQDPFDVEGRRWTLSVYGAAGDNQYHVEWQTRIMAGTASGTGIAIADIDGDGQLEWIVALMPHLYVFTTDGRGGYEPVYYEQIRRTQRPAVGDFDGDGRQEVVYNRAAGGLESVGWTAPDVRLFAPGAWSAVPAGPDRVSLSWEPVAGATAYRVRRDGEAVAEVEDAGSALYTHIDSGLVSARAYEYEVFAVDSAGASGHSSPSQVVEPGPLPVVTDIERISARQLSISFDQSMGSEASEPFRYHLRPDVTAAEAAVLDRSGQRVVVAFADELPEQEGVSLQLSGLRSVHGGALATPTVDVSLLRPIAATRLLTVSATDDLSIDLRFDRPIDVETAAVTIDGGAIQVEGVAAIAAGLGVGIQLSSQTPLRSRGRGYELSFSGLRDDLGREVEGRAFVMLSPTELTEIVAFPNPFDPRTQVLSVGGLPPEARVRLFSISGELVWSAAENDADGGVRWNGRNDSGQQVAAGIYLLLATHEGRTRRARIAVLPAR